MTLAAADFAGELRHGFPGGFEIGCNVHAPLYAISVPAVKKLVRGFGNVLDRGTRYSWGMSKKVPKPRHFLREWRLFRGMTLEQLGEAVGTTKGVISELELSKKGLSLKWLYRLAPALKTSPGMIVDYNPEDVDPEALDAFLRVGGEDKGQVLKIIGTFRKAG